MQRDGEPALVPVGHYHGVLYLAEGPSRWVRLGDVSTVRLGEAEHEAWLLAHEAVPEEQGVRLRTEAELIEAGGNAEALARLRERGLVDELPVGPREQAAFAERYRLVPLAPGLGNEVRGEAGWFGVGLPGRRGHFQGLAGRWLALHTLGYDLWRSSGAAQSLAEACAWQVAPEAEGAEGAGPVDPALIDLDRLDRPTAVDQAVRIVAPLISSWAAAVQPAAESPLVPSEQRVGSVLPPVEPADPAGALDPEEILRIPLRDDLPLPAEARERVTLSIPRWEADPGHPGAAGWLFAVGHDGGVLHRVADGVLVGRRVRIGAEDVLLTPEESQLWQLTATGDPHRLWNRSAVAAAAVGEGVADAGRTLAGLIERGVVVEVHPGTEQARVFAERYRLRPLLHGLGDKPDDHRLYQIGVPGRRPISGHGVEERLLWETAGQTPTLWASVELLTGHLRDLGRRSPGGPDDFLTRRVFTGIRRLIESGTAYLDLAPV